MDKEEERLIKASDDVLYLVMQMFTYYAWFRHVAPQTNAAAAIRHESAYLQMVQNAIVEAQLMYYRRLNEFFYPQPQKEKYSDDLRAYKFGYTELGPFLRSEDMEELHKRVAHPTFREADSGKVGYEIYSTSWMGLRHGLKFMSYLKTKVLSVAPDKVETVRVFERTIHELWDRWTAEVPESERRAL